MVGRPGLDPGTLGLKEGCIWSEWSGGVGIIRESKKTCPVVSDSSGGVGLVCGMKCGISERTVQLRIALAHVRSRGETLKRRPRHARSPIWKANLRELALRSSRSNSGSSPVRPTEDVNFATLHLVKIGFESGDERFSIVAAKTGLRRRHRLCANRFLSSY
jgi:hypothetical protein